jgi:hypothetical protein
MFAVQTTTDPAEILAEYPTGKEAAEHAQRLNEQFRTQGKDTRVRVVRRNGDSAAEDMVWAAGYPQRGGMEYINFSDATAEEYQRYYGMRVFKIPASGAEWRGREMRRNRAEIPWRGESWWHISEHWPLHYPYPSERDKCKIAFTQSEEYGRADRQTVMRPGAYLTRYFSDVLTAEQIQEYALAWANTFSPRELEYARTADQIEYVYVNGPSSCMSHGPDSFDSGIHPCRVYAGPDLELAYIRNDAGEITGRAILWPDKKVYSGMYGDYERMRDALEREGYNTGDLLGARIQRIPHGNTFIGPYIDCAGYVDDAGDYLIIGGGGYNARNTNGLFGYVNTCCRCDDPVDEDELHHDPYDGDPYCVDCYDETYTWCVDCEEAVSRSEAVEDQDGEWRCQQHQNEGYTDCDHWGEETPGDEIYTAPDDSELCSACHTELVGVCEHCGYDCMRQ